MTARLCLWALCAGGAAFAVDPATPARTISIPIQGQPSREAGVAAGPAIPVAAVAFHPAGKLVAASGYGEVLLWDLEAGALAGRLGAGQIAGKIRALAFSPDGNTLAVAGGVPGVSGTVRLLEVAGGSGTDAGEPAKDEIAAMAFHPSGKHLAIGGPDGAVRIWSVAERKTIATLKEHAEAVTTIAFSPDGKYMASGSTDRNLQVWDAAEWKPLMQLPQTAGDPIYGVGFSRENDALAFVTGGDNERAVRVWRTEFAPEPKEGDPNAPRLRAGRRVTRPVDLWTCAPMGVAWAPGIANHANGALRTARIYVACSDKMVRVLSNTGGYVSTLTGHQDWIYAVAVSPDGLKVAAGAGDGTTRVWNRADGTLMATLVQTSPREDRWAVVTPRGYFAAAPRAEIVFRGIPKPAAEELAQRLRNPEAVRNILAGRPPVAQSVSQGKK